MAAPSRHHAVLSHPRWEAAFGRQTTIEAVLEYIRAHWQERQKLPPPDMQYSSSEPRITKYFGLSLRKHARDRGILGYFIPENSVAYIDEVRQVLESRGRTDLTYFESGQKDSIEFVVEFKKMKSVLGANASRKAYCQDGMLRFVNAVYAREEDLGFMVGLVEQASQLPDSLDGLKRAIQNPDMALLLNMIKNPRGRTVTSKGHSFKSCDFETRHARDHVGYADVVLGHFLLAHRPD